MLPGASGLRPMPRKMAGMAMITIELSKIAMNMPSEVLESAIHLYRSSGPDSTTTWSPCVVVSDKLAQPFE